MTGEKMSARFLIRSLWWESIRQFINSIWEKSAFAKASIGSRFQPLPCWLARLCINQPCRMLQVEFTGEDPHSKLAQADLITKDDIDDEDSEGTSDDSGHDQMVEGKAHIYMSWCRRSAHLANSFPQKRTYLCRRQSKTTYLAINHQCHSKIAVFEHCSADQSWCSNSRELFRVWEGASALEDHINQSCLAAEPLFERMDIRILLGSHV